MRRNLLDDDQPDSPDQAPGWMVSYGDMMSLLLTLFVMLISMSEIKQNDKFQGVADSLHEQFSLYQTTPEKDDSVLPRNAALAGLAVAGRQSRQAVMAAANFPRLSSSADSKFRPVSWNRRSKAGGTIAFDPTSVQLSPEAGQQLRTIAQTFFGQSHPIEIRALAPPSAEGSEGLDVAWQRAQATARELVSQCGVEPDRLRISIAVMARSGPTTGPAPTTEKPMVEVFLLDEN